MSYFTWPSQTWGYQWGTESSAPPQTGMIGWFKADTGIFTNAGRTTPATNGQTVVGWADQSPAANNLTATRGPVYNSTGGPNNKPYLACTGTYFTFDSIRTITGMEFFVVANMTGTDVMFIDHLSGSPNYFTYIASSGPQWILNVFDSNGLNSAGFSEITSVFNANHIFNANFDSTGGLVQVDNTTPATHAFVNYQFVFDVVGESTPQPGTYNLNGKFCEMLIYNRKLTSTERATVMSYLNTKYTIY